MIDLTFFNLLISQYTWEDGQTCSVARGPCVGSLWQSFAEIENCSVHQCIGICISLHRPCLVQHTPTRIQDDAMTITIGGIGGNGATPPFNRHPLRESEIRLLSFIHRLSQCPCRIRAILPVPIALVLEVVNTGVEKDFSQRRCCISSQPHYIIRHSIRIIRFNTCVQSQHCL